MNNAILCRNLHKTYPARPTPVQAVNGLDLEVRRGECFGLLGPNGAGKTTTIEILEGLLSPTSGVVEVLGKRWGTPNDRELRKLIGISLQETRLSEKLTVGETVRLFRSFHDEGIDPDAALDLVDLGGKKSAFVGKLSGGQKQRLAVALALVGNPQLLFLDEPTTGLDPQSRRQLWDILRQLKTQGRTILLTTHYMDEAEKLCDRVAVVDHGKVIALGSPRDLIAKIGGDHFIEFALEGDTEVEAEFFQNVPAVVHVHREGATWSLAVSAPHLALPALLEKLRAQGQSFSQLTTRHATLEDVFVTLTGRHLRDDS